MSDGLDLLAGIAREAAQIINAVYATPFEVEYKTAHDPVTLADRRANDLICQRLAEEFPGVPVVAEESPPESFADYRGAERVFFVDPLDGTREFVKKNGEFVVMIGLLEAGRPISGVILAPATGVLWAGRVASKAERVRPDGKRSALGVSFDVVAGGGADRLHAFTQEPGPRESPRRPRRASARRAGQRGAQVRGGRGRKGRCLRRTGTRGLPLGRVRGRGHHCRRRRRAHGRLRRAHRLLEREPGQ